jgi:hypothetical protein
MMDGRQEELDRLTKRHCTKQSVQRNSTMQPHSRDLQARYFIDRRYCMTSSCDVMGYSLRHSKEGLHRKQLKCLQQAILKR